MSIMALDLGRRRIGVAIAGPSGLGATPVATLHRHSLPEDFDALRTIVAEWRVRQVILGLPVNMDGSEGPAARHARQFAHQLADALELPVELYDERLTSFEARERLKHLPGGRASRKAMVDQVAAVVILEGWLAEHGASEKPHVGAPLQVASESQPGAIRWRTGS